MCIGFKVKSTRKWTAGAVIGPQWAVLIDTLIPQETAQIKDFWKMT